MAALVYRDTHNGAALVYRDTQYTAGAGDITAPTLTAAAATATGPTTATGSVTTDEAGGTLYATATASAMATATQVQTGASKAVTEVGAQSVTFAGLPASTTLYPHYVHVDAAGNVSAVINGASFTTAAPPSTVTGVTVSPATATLAGGATIDFDWIIAGTNSPSQAATVATNLGTINSAGLLTAPAATSSAQTGTVTVTSTQDTTKSGTATFTVSALAGDTTGPVMQGTITATKTSTTTDLAWPAATDANGVAEYFVSKDGGAAVSTGTTRSKSFTGLAPLSTHQYEITARDTAGNGSTNSLLVTVTTDADAVDPIPDPPQEMKPVTIAQFRLDFPEFGNPTKYTDAQIRVQLVAASMVLGELQWGDLWGYGVELRTAHFLTIRARNLAAAAAGGVGGAVSGLLTSKAVDKVSASYDVGATTYEGAGFWNTSSYGIEFWQLLMMFGAGPIQL